MTKKKTIAKWTIQFLENAHIGPNFDALLLGNGLRFCKKFLVSHNWTTEYVRIKNPLYPRPSSP